MKIDWSKEYCFAFFAWLSNSSRQWALKIQISGLHFRLKLISMANNSQTRKSKQPENRLHWLQWKAGHQLIAGVLSGSSFALIKFLISWNKKGFHSNVANRRVFSVRLMCWLMRFFWLQCYSSASWASFLWRSHSWSFVTTEGIRWFSRSQKDNTRIF